MTKDEALKLALEALDKYGFAPCDKEEDWQGFKRTITAIKEALAQHDSVQAKPEPEQEPFAYVNVEKRRLEFAHDYVKWDTPTTIKLDKIPLYTTPPQRKWVGLTNNDLQPIAEEYRILFGSWVHDFARAIEAKLKEKNTRQDGDCKHCVNGCPACDARRQSNVLP